MTESGKTFESHVVRVADLAGDRPNRFIFRATRNDDRKLAQEIGALRVMRTCLRGSLVKRAGGDWRLDAHLQARVVQQCITSLQHLTTVIRTPVQRTYVQDPAHMASGADNRIPEDDDLELLGDTIDFYALSREVLILELPLYPRSPDASVRLPGTGDDDPDEKPFAGLADFYRLLKESGQGPGSS
ncbi:MAG: DUF177 domain-containing protein [Rhodobacteraceae bacterium]|nr:DUF177 domain-containing protein [Paracoccaceae bacterium]